METGDQRRYYGGAGLETYIFDVSLSTSLVHIVCPANLLQLPEFFHYL